MVSLQSARVSSLLTNKLPRLCVSRTLANFPRDRRIHKSLDDYKWPSFKNWTPYMVEKLGIKFHEYNKFEDAFPVVSINDNKDEETLLPPLVCEFVRDNINESFIASGDYITCSHELIPLLSSLRAILQQAEGERAKVLAMVIINLMELISEETYFSQSPIALALGSSIVQGDIDLSICKHRGFRLELFKTPRAVGRVAQEWPQIAGHLLASCMENIGDTVKPQEYQQ